MLRERNMLDPDRLPQPRHVRLRMVDETKHPLTLYATLIPTIGDVVRFTEAAGCRFYQPALARLACTYPRPPFPCILIHEPHNPHDGNAVALWTRGGRSGYLPRSLSPRVLGPLTRLEAEHHTLIAVNAELAPTDYGLSLWVELPREMTDGRA